MDFLFTFSRKEKVGFRPFSAETEDDAFSQIQASSTQYRYATGPNKGKKAFALKSVPSLTKVGLVAERSGFSLHAGVVMADRKKLEKLARYIARPPIAVDRLRLNEQGKVVYELKKPYSDGISYIVMSPLELLEKITAIIPRPNDFDLLSIIFMRIFKFLGCGQTSCMRRYYSK